MCDSTHTQQEVFWGEKKKKTRKMDQIKNARCASWVVSSEKDLESGHRHFVPTVLDTQCRTTQVWRSRAVSLDRAL